MDTKILVSWTNGTELGVYEAKDGDAAILAAVQDAGYKDIDDAAQFIFDEDGECLLECEYVETKE